MQHEKQDSKHCTLQVNYQNKSAGVFTVWGKVSGCARIKLALFLVNIQTAAHMSWCFSSSFLSFRSSALGFFTGVGRVAAIMGNVAFGKLVDTNCAIPVLLVSALLLTGGLVALLLPQTRQTELTWWIYITLFYINKLLENILLISSRKQTGASLIVCLSPVFAPRGYLNPVPSVISLCLCTVPHLKCQRQEKIVYRQRGLHFRRIIIPESEKVEKEMPVLVQQHFFLQSYRLWACDD